MSRKQPPNLRADMVVAALRVARRVGYAHMTRDAIATEAGCSTGQVTIVLGTMPQLRRSVMRAAVQARDLPVIAQGLAARDANARSAPDDVKRLALQGLL